MKPWIQYKCNCKAALISAHVVFGIFEHPPGRDHRTSFRSQQILVPGLTPGNS